MRGFTLIETLVYLALYSILMTGVIASLFSLQSGMERVEAGARLTDEGHFLLEVVRFKLERAYSVEIMDSGMLVLQNKEERVSFRAFEKTFVMETSEGSVRLTEPTSEITDLSFSKALENGARISFTLQTYTAGGLPLAATFSETLFPLRSL